MTCCFFNLHEKENAKDLVKHFDKEIEHAIDWGCSVFLAGTNYPEDDIFAERVMEAAKHYAEGVIKVVRVKEKSDEKLKSHFIDVADWEIYSYE